ncbi:hypothetical protein QQS21_007310 [Conoideocrella luteorostrata]|uniref:Glucose-methanol-choline oxidoreductase N-terminal domain-containing protein n=1 Tax=Conoideocrella luteorostrata TaxID=1105319 RepID=A0AAJ0CNR7_9HYPO|nr:hypothetical protein QQS21_007310 [Conoideocrella luteorostrata]
MKPFLWLALLGNLTAAFPRNTSQEYDYVVVGSGPGGGPLAASLAREGHSVFLMEAGGDRGDELLQQVPGFADVNAETPGMSWQFFVSHYQNETQARRDRSFTYRLINGSLWHGIDPPEDAEPLGIYYPRGATVGGSAIANAMNVVLPPDSDWDYIANVTGDHSWTASQVRQHFVELERNTYMPVGTPGHGFNGYIATNRNNISYVMDRPGLKVVVRNTISQLENLQDLSDSHVAGLLERDLNRADADRYEQEGVYQIPLHIDENRRRSSPWNFITETRSARTTAGSPKYPLTLSTHSLATKILTREGANGTPKAYGVEYLVGQGLYEADRRYNSSSTGELRTVRARKEVIIAGGAFNTPQILKLSGIGPRAELEQHNISVVVDLPAVGSYMQDNYEAGINVRASTAWDNNPFAECRFDINGSSGADPCLEQWRNGYGAYGEGAAPVFLLQRTSQSENNDSDLITFGGAGAVFDGHYPGFSTVQLPPTSLFSGIVKMQNHNPTGTVRLRSNNPRQMPEISLNFFQEGGETDIQALTEGLERAMSIVNATGEPYAPFEIVDPPADRSLRQHILDHTWSHHVVGSCRMGAAGDALNSCVGPDFRVHGIDSLRVVDGSIFPRAPGGFPVGATYVVSRKAFHTIMGDDRKCGK